MWVRHLNMTETRSFVCLSHCQARPKTPTWHWRVWLFHVSLRGRSNRGASFTIAGCVFVCVRCAPGFLGEYCQHKDPCQPGYCLNGGNCSVSTSAGVPVPGSATCSCPLGYTGQHCQSPQNSTCYPNNPCANRGVCTLLPFNKYKCECARGWTGKMMPLF